MRAPSQGAAYYGINGGSAADVYQSGRLSIKRSNQEKNDA
jgi:hypothetical protein